MVAVNFILYDAEMVIHWRLKARLVNVQNTLKQCGT